VAVYDPDQPNAAGTTLCKDAAVSSYGPAFGNPADPPCSLTIFDGYAAVPAKHTICTPSRTRQDVILLWVALPVAGACLTT
jgi:hypothetical protein